MKIPAQMIQSNIVCIVCLRGFWQIDVAGGARFSQTDLLMKIVVCKAAVHHSRREKTAMGAIK